MVSKSNASFFNHVSNLKCYTVPDFEYDSDSDIDDDNYRDTFNPDVDYDDEFEKRRDFIADIITYFVFEKYFHVLKNNLSLKDALNKFFPGTYLEVRDTLQGMAKSDPRISKIITKENLLPTEDSLQQDTNS